MTDPTSLFTLTGQTAVVTGGGGALGRAICSGLAGVGASVVVVDIRQDAASAAADEIVSRGGRAIGVAADLGSPDEVDRVFTITDDTFGPVRLLVNAISGSIDRSTPEDFPLADWNTMISANLTSYFLCSQAAARRMIPAGNGGSIVNFASIAGVSALGRGNLAYSVAKGGVVQMTRELAFAWAPHNIRVNAILPSQFVNAWWQSQLDDPAHTPLVDRVLSGIPLGRLGEPSEIVGPVIFLASPAASMVTGVLLPVDGGNLAMNAGASQDW
jgi:NAD(P)-dependent dehydrogenase (short-subunit alcohol dehydrogenase family)